MVTDAVMCKLRGRQQTADPICWPPSPTSSTPNSTEQPPRQPTRRPPVP